MDASISAPPPDSVGSAVGDRLHVQWWTAPSGGFFAVQVLDTETTSLWDLFHIPTSGSQSVAGCRVCFETAAGAPSLEAAWRTVFVPILGEVVNGARCPSFVEIVAAGSSPSGVTAIREEAALIANLQADLDYWSQLARSLSKAQRPAVAQQDAPSAAQEAPETHDPEAIKEWRLREIDRWALANEHRITILPRAIAATKRSPYENHQLLYECLELLATEYTQVKTGVLDRFAFKQKADALGLEYGGSVAPSNAGEYGDQYFIRWRGRRRFLDQHLSKGNARDPRFCLRLYYTWDDVSRKVIVGSMPAHLGTSGT
ncbi:hypothetical protein [Acidovorax sp.]|uniref:hypothetical protein n=1 Tax=Acidovorax sp. TaxID=1872122 RepID=UPI00391FC00C